MASYADMAKRGPKQSKEDAAAPQLDEIQPSDSSVASLIDVDSGVSVVSHDFPDQDVKTETQAQRIQIEEQVAREEQEARERAEARRRAREGHTAMQQFLNNPVYIASASVTGALLLTLGFAGYRSYSRGHLSWKLVGIWTGAVAAYGVAEFYAVEFFNKKWQQRK